MSSRSRRLPASTWCALCGRGPYETEGGFRSHLTQRHAALSAKPISDLCRAAMYPKSLEAQRP